MNKHLLIASVFLISSLSHAQQSFKVVKIQGRKAIVEVADPSMLTLNQSYNVSDASMPVSTGGKGGKREHALGMDFTYQSTSNPTSSLLILAGDYLWNMRTYEVGPLLAIHNQSISGVSTNTTEFGGLGFYNFNENRPGVETILAAVGQLSVTSGVGSSTTNIAFGGNYRWFALSQDHCFSFSALYAMAQSSGTSASGFLIKGGISTYF